VADPWDDDDGAVHYTRDGYTDSDEEQRTPDHGYYDNEPSTAWGGASQILPAASSTHILTPRGFS